MAFEEKSAILAQRLKEARKNRGLTQRQVCLLLNIEIGTLSGYEIGRRSPNSSRIVELADIYGVSTDYLLGVSDTLLPSTSSQELISLDNVINMPGFIDAAAREISRIQMIGLLIDKKHSPSDISTKFKKLSTKEQLEFLKTFYSGVIAKNGNYILKPKAKSKEMQDAEEKLKSLSEKDRQAMGLMLNILN